MNSRQKPWELEFRCPECRAIQRVNGLRSRAEARCKQCLKPIPFFRASSEGWIERCLACGNEQLYVQKDFNRRLGLGIVLVGILLSYHTYGLSLLVCATIDVILYQVLPVVTVCYRCGAIHRGFANNPRHVGFDMHTAEQYDTH